MDVFCISSHLCLFLPLNVESLQRLTLNHSFLCTSSIELVYLLKNSSCQLDALIPLPHPIRKMLIPTLPFSETCLVLTSLAPHERLPEILVVSREKTPTGAAARGNP